MPALIILSSFGFVLATYFWVAARERNFVNVLTPLLLLQVPTNYVFELAYLATIGEAGSLYAYFYCYATYTLGFIAMAAGYLAMSHRVIPIFVRIPKIQIPGAPYLFLAIGLLLYLPVLLEYPELITSPRSIYLVTRTGYGVEFFLSSFAVYVGTILYCFSGRTRSGLSMWFSLLALVILYLHGSKSQALYFFMILLCFVVFAKGMRFGVGRFVGMVISGSVVIFALFYLTFSADLRRDMLTNIVGYSDYTRNAMTVIDDPGIPYQYGRLTAGQTAYSLIPRALDPEKPRDFGGLWLAKRYAPERYEANTGAPDYGIGVLYADFGPFAICFYVLGALLTGIVLKILVVRLRSAPDAATFVMLLTLLDIPLIPAGVPIPLPVYYLCAIAVGALSRDRGALITDSSEGSARIAAP